MRLELNLSERRSSSVSDRLIALSRLVARKSISYVSRTIVVEARSFDVILELSSITIVAKTNRISISNEINEQ